VKKYFDEYIASLDNCKIKNLRELVQFNKDHADIELPPGQLHVHILTIVYFATTLLTKKPGNDNQDWLEKFLADKSTPEQQAEYLAFARKLGRTEGVDKIMKDHGVDVILAPSECSITFVSSASGESLISIQMICCHILWNYQADLFHLRLSFINYAFGLSPIQWCSIWYVSNHYSRGRRYSRQSHGSMGKDIWAKTSPRYF